MIQRLPVILIILVAIGISAHGQSSGDNSGTISGRVVTDSGQPLGGATLFVRAINSIGAQRNITADAEGNFRVNGLEPALYSISATAPAYASDPAPPMYYRPGDSVRLELVRGGVITGTVTNSAGEPVISVRVRAIRIRDANGQTPRLPAFGYREQPTDDRGVYRIYGLLPGTYLVSAGGGVSFYSNFNPYENDVPTYAPSATRDNASEISVRSGEEISVDIRYRGEPGHSISGTTKVAGTNSATVALRMSGSPFPLANTFQPSGGRGFLFSGLADGEYTLRAQEFVAEQLPNTALMKMATKRVTIKGANVTGIELITTLLASISGRVLLEPSKVPECEGKRAPLFAETLVQLQRPEKETEDEDGIYVGPVGGVASPDASGALVWRNVMAGRYRFEPRFYARYWYLKSIIINTSGAKPQKIDAAASWTSTKSGDQLNGVTITLAEGAASMRGHAQPGTIFYLIPAEPDKATDVLRLFAADVAPDGTFSLNNLPPGKYLALAQETVDPQIATQTKLREPEAATARAKLRRTAEAKKTEIELKPCQNLTDYQLKQ
jgi:carboxypeptidase family protein